MMKNETKKIVIYLATQLIHGVRGWGGGGVRGEYWDGGGGGGWGDLDENRQKFQLEFMSPQLAPLCVATIRDQTLFKCGSGWFRWPIYRAFFLVSAGLI
jgi:hypothetical protein